MTPYQTKKRALLFCIEHYSNKTVVTEEDTFLTIDEVEALYTQDQHLLTRYQGELLVLEAYKLLKQ